MAESWRLGTLCSRLSASTTPIEVAERSVQSTSVGISTCSWLSSTCLKPSGTVSESLRVRTTSLATVMGFRPTFAMSHIRCAPGAERSRRSLTATVSFHRRPRMSHRTASASRTEKAVHVCVIWDAPWLSSFRARHGSPVIWSRLRPHVQDQCRKTDELFEECDRIARPNEAAFDHPRAQSAPARMVAVIDARELAIQKGGADLPARRGVAGEQQLHRPDLQPVARSERRPLHAG